ncbi:MAG: hypothetical protein IT318_24665 [Anaerolineales bacterium]|nr:hypothetical protein [Anaerolineales bacterium]
MATLKEQLTDQLAWCRRHVEQRQRIELKGGLRITVYIDGAGAAHVMLARDGAKGPSDDEARTVLAHWPEPIAGPVTWERAAGRLAAWMTATLPKTNQLSLFDSPTQPHTQHNHNP